MNHTAGDKRYQVQDDSKLVINVFDSREKAITNAIEMAYEYRKVNFFVIEKDCETEKSIFEICINLDFDFSDTKTVYSAFTTVFSRKLAETSKWYKK